MKASRYNILQHPENANSSGVLFNTLHGAIVQFSADEYTVLAEALANPNMPFGANPFMAMLHDEGFIISNHIDELAILEDRKRAGMRDQNRLDIILMPTLDCNFGCQYCYETRQKGLLTPENSSIIAAWLRKKIPGFKLVMFHWFGGEPLMAFDQMSIITEAAREAADANKAKLCVNVTTNGYLFDERKIKRLIDLGVLSYQITLDGPPITHNKLRPLRSGKPTFEKCFSNIIALARSSANVKISLRVNFNHTNLDYIPALLAMFPPDTRSRIRLALEPIFGANEVSATGNLSSQEISSKTQRFYSEAREMGFDIIFGKSSLNAGKLVYCYAERENQYVINYDRSVFKCGVSDFAKSKRCGYIDEDAELVKMPEWESWVDQQDLFNEACRSCIYLPLCMGGCRKSRLMHGTTGSFCALVATNASYALKHVAFGSLREALMNDCVD